MVQKRLSRLFRGFTFLVAMTIVMPAQAEGERRLRVIAYGDSLTAGFGVAPADAFPVQLEKSLRARGHNVEVVNSGVSGDSAASGLERFDWAVPDDADAVILELGANDGLRGADPAGTRATLETLITRLKARKLPVLLAGMRAPRNWGEAYAVAFDAMFAELAAKHGVLLYPFFLDGVVMDRAFNQSDGIHPTAKGVGEIVTRITPKVEELIALAAGGKR